MAYVHEIHDMYTIIHDLCTSWTHELCTSTRGLCISTTTSVHQLRVHQPIIYVNQPMYINSMNNVHHLITYEDNQRPMYTNAIMTYSHQPIICVHQPMTFRYHSVMLWEWLNETLYPTVVSALHLVFRPHLVNRCHTFSSSQSSGEETFVSWKETSCSELKSKWLEGDGWNWNVL